MAFFQNISIKARELEQKKPAQLKGSYESERVQQTILCITHNLLRLN